MARNTSVNQYIWGLRHQFIQYDLLIIFTIFAKAGSPQLASHASANLSLLKHQAFCPEAPMTPLQHPMKL